MSELEKLGILPEDASLLLQALDDRAVNLLIGAGVSYGVLGGDGQELKGGRELAQELNDKFNLENVEPESSNLQLVFGDIAASQTLRPALADFMYKRFSRCQSKWQEKILYLPWKRIWSLNIDDVIQKSALKIGFTQLKSFSWDDSYDVRSLSSSELQVIHLHGRASQIDVALNRIIFSMKSYAARHENSPGWHSEFRSEFTKKPFIICGARLRDEFDLATVLEFGNKSRERGGSPSFIVLREFAPGEVGRFKRQGMVPVASTAEIFFEALYADLELWRRDRAAESKELREAKMSVRASFKLLSSTPPRPRHLLDFYSSTEAQWQHIVDNLDARLEQITASSTWLSEGKIDARIVLISGGFVCGKTASALRIAASLEERGYESWHFRNEERFDEEAVCEYISSTNKVLLVMDDCADFSSSISSLITLVMQRRLSLRIVATIEAWRLRGIRADLCDANVRVIELEPISGNHFESICNKRREKGRLGRCTSMSMQELWEEFRDKFNQRSLEWLESLEGAQTYRQRITELLSAAISSTPERRVVLTTAAAHRFGYSLPFYLANSLIGPDEVENLVNPPSQYADLAFLDDKGLRLRSRSIAIDVWKNATPRERYSISLYLAKQLAPLVVPHAISRRTYPYRILRQLMDCDVVENDVGANADQWYEDLIQMLGWNSRYWEQRALLASKQARDEAAYSFAKRAVDLHPGHQYSHTTLGKVCMQISVRRRDDIGLERFWEGNRELETSRYIAREKNNISEHPFVTFFSYTLQAYQIYGDRLSGVDRKWKEWMKEATHSLLYEFDLDGKSQIDMFSAQWLKLTVFER